MVNNIAWTVRKFPIVPIFGSGEYKVQAVFVEDLAEIAVSSMESENSETTDAIGSETYTYNEFLQSIAKELDRKILFLHVWFSLGIFFGKMISFFVYDTRT